MHGITIMTTFRTGSFVVATDTACDGTYNRVGKAVAKVRRINPLNVYEEMTLFRMNYNGQYYVIPSDRLRKATSEEKKQDRKDDSYWRQNNCIRLSQIYWVARPTTYVPFL